MRTAVPEFPEARLRELADRYAAAVAAKRRRVWLGSAVLIVAAHCCRLDGRCQSSEVSSRISGASRPILPASLPKFSFSTAWVDLAEWLWGLPRWTAASRRHVADRVYGNAHGSDMRFRSLLPRIGQSRQVRVRPCFVTRRVLEFCRTVPEIVFALIFVLAFGLGPLPGVLAIAIHTTGALGKQFAEVVENIDSKPIEGVAASGGSWLQIVRFGAVPQVLSNFVSYALLRFEINVRGAAVMGFVGAGGIGQDLIEAVRKFYYTDVSAILLLIIVTVMMIDFVTERVRHRLLGLEGCRSMSPSVLKTGPRIAERYPDIFRPDWWHRAKDRDRHWRRRSRFFVFGIVQLDIPFHRLSDGMVRLGGFVRLMVPPDPGSWAEALKYLHALGETLSIAFLGTLGGALLALPVSPAGGAQRGCKPDRPPFDAPQPRYHPWRRYPDLGPHLGRRRRVGSVCRYPGGRSAAILGRSGSCSRKRSRLPTRTPSKASDRRAATICIASGSDCCRRSFRFC